MRSQVYGRDPLVALISALEQSLKGAQIYGSIGRIDCERPERHSHEKTRIDRDPRGAAVVAPYYAIQCLILCRSLLGVTPPIYAGGDELMTYVQSINPRRVSGIDRD